MEICPPSGDGVCEVRGLDLTGPLSDSGFADIYQAFLVHTSILILGQATLSPKRYESFAARFGTILQGIPATGRQAKFDDKDVRRTAAPKYTLPDHANIFVITDQERDGKPLGLAKAGMYWHSDLYYKEVPAKATFLRCTVAPRRGGRTLLMNMYRVYDALSDELRSSLDGLTVWHSWATAWPYCFPSRAPLNAEEISDTPDVEHPLVVYHPETARKVLYIGAFYHFENPGIEIRGMPSVEAIALYEELKQHALQERFSHAHEWRSGDLLIIDNRAAMHSRAPFDEVGGTRVLQRITVMGDAPVPSGFDQGQVVSDQPTAR